MKSPLFEQSKRLSSPVFDIIRNLLRKHVNSALRQIRRQEGERARVHHPQPPDAKDPGPRIHHRARVPRFPHGARRRGVVDLGAAAPDEVEDLGVRPRGGAGQLLGAQGDGAHAAEGLPGAPEARDGDLRVRGVREPVGVDDGQVRRVGGPDGDGAAREGGDEGGDDGPVVEAVVEEGRGWLGGVADVGVYGQVGHLGPVRRERGEGGVG